MKNKKENSKAIESYKEAVRINPNNINCRYYMAALLIKEKQYDEAIIELQLYIDKKGLKSPRAYFDSMCLCQ